jgi:hypothetical protein
MRRLLAILLFAAGGLATELVHPVSCSCIVERSQRAGRKDTRTDRR